LMCLRRLDGFNGASRSAIQQNEITALLRVSNPSPRSAIDRLGSSFLGNDLTQRGQLLFPVLSTDRSNKAHPAAWHVNNSSNSWSRVISGTINQLLLRCAWRFENVFGNFDYSDPCFQNTCFLEKKTACQTFLFFLSYVHIYKYGNTYKTW
jgi:hypothetical protein